MFNRMKTLSIFFKTDILGHVSDFDPAGKHKLDETHTEHEFCLTTITDRVSIMKK